LAGLNGITVRLGGELDMASVPAIKTEIESHLADRVSTAVFDLGSLTFMDSSGITLLVQLSNQADHVEVRNPTPTVRRVLEATGLLKRFGLEDEDLPADTAATNHTE
jgi:anti-anti-sigma factor